MTLCVSLVYTVVDKTGLFKVHIMDSSEIKFNGFILFCTNKNHCGWWKIVATLKMYEPLFTVS